MSDDGEMASSAARYQSIERAIIIRLEESSHEAPNQAGLTPCAGISSAATWLRADNHGIGEPSRYVHSFAPSSSRGGIAVRTRSPARADAVDVPGRSLTGYDESAVLHSPSSRIHATDAPKGMLDMNIGRTVRRDGPVFSRLKRSYAACQDFVDEGVYFASRAV